MSSLHQCQNLMKIIAFTLLLCLSVSAFSQQVDSFRIKSSHLEDSRLIKVWTPRDFSADKKYTVVYTLDASLLFDITCSNVQFLSRDDVVAIPNTIVVGVFFEDRNDDMGILWDDSELDEKGRAFKKMLSEELIPRIDKDYPTTGFNAIVGHSNSSTYINFLLYDNDSPFRGYIAMSQYELAKDVKRIEEKMKGTLSKNIYYFLATAAQDAPYRVESGEAFEKTFTEHTNPKVKFAHKVYDDGNHLTVALLGISSGLIHTYQDYKSLDATNEELINELAKTKTNPLAYLKKYKSELSQHYGVEPKSTIDDLYFMFTLAQKNKDKKQVEELWEFAQKEFPNEEGMKFLFAQAYEAAGFYKKAEELYLKHLDSDDYKAYYAYSRPFYLYYSHERDPIKAIKMAKRANKEFAEEEKDFSFYYHIAQTCAKFNTKSYLGRKSINKYIDNHSAGARFPLEKAYYQKARIYTNTRRDYEAKQLLKQALELNPEFKAAKELLDELNEY